MPKPITLTREELYNQIWAEPLMHVAKRLGLSDRGLAKVCARYEIPVPPRGWWAKQQHGHSVRQVPLPALKTKGAEHIAFYPQVATAQGEEPAELVREKLPQWQIEVPDDLAIRHPIVRQTAAAMRSASRQGKQGPVHWNDRYRAMLVRPGAGHLDIAVSRRLVPRALRIMQALVTALERRGYSLVNGDDGRTFVVVLEESLEIALLERFRQVVVKRTYGSSTELEPAGRLFLRVGGQYSSSGVEDGGNRVEKVLNRFVARLVRRALDTKHQRAVTADRQRRWRLHDDEARKRQQEVDSERLRTRRLRQAAAALVRHRRQAEFVAAVEARVSADAVSQEERDLARRWVEWAQSVLAGTDPIDRVLEDPWPVAPLRPEAAMPWNWE